MTLFNLSELLENVYVRSRSFSGIGLVVYSGLESISFTSLRKEKPSLTDLKVDDDSLISFLVEISKYGSEFHDGFHFMTENAKLTHVAQFVSPPIVESEFIHWDNGARSRAAQYLSFVNGVVLCGIVSSKGGLSIYSNGKAVESRSLGYTNSMR